MVRNDKIQNFGPLSAIGPEWQPFQLWQKTTSCYDLLRQRSLSINIMAITLPIFFIFFTFGYSPLLLTEPEKIRLVNLTNKKLGNSQYGRRQH